MSVIATASPSLALTKYWGKQAGGVNLPATSSLAITLGKLTTQTEIDFAAEGTPDQHLITINDSPIDACGYEAIIRSFRSRAEGGARAMRDRPLVIRSTNSFPTAAGVASSSSGFAALALALDRLYETALSRRDLSAIARIGSGSASRALFGGFTMWEAGSEAAEPFLPHTHWPELRLLVAVVSTEKKPVSSRTAMTRAKETSPFYDAWVGAAPAIFSEAKHAVEALDIEKLGELMRSSYLQMFGTMFTTRPPVIYWIPASLAIIRTAEHLRGEGVPVWETMDAGPQVKLLTTEAHLEKVEAAVRSSVPEVTCLHSAIGGDPEVHQA